jgi:hypothetical protein
MKVKLNNIPLCELNLWIILFHLVPIICKKGEKIKIFWQNKGKILERKSN